MDINHNAVYRIPCISRLYPYIAPPHPISFFHLITSIYCFAVPVTSVNLTSNVDPISVITGTKVRIQCVTSAGRPTPSVTWYLESVLGTKENITTEIQQFNSSADGLVAINSTLTYTTSQTDNQKKVYCQASNLVGQTLTSGNYVINVLCTFLFFKLSHLLRTTTYGKIKHIYFIVNYFYKHNIFSIIFKNIKSMTGLLQNVCFLNSLTLSTLSKRYFIPFISVNCS